MKTVKTRDGATTILRKLGLNSREYSLFMEKTADGFVVNDVEARKHVCKEVVIDLVAHKDVILKPALPDDPLGMSAALRNIQESGKKLEVVAPKVPKQSISGLAEELLLAGKSNAETWAALKERFKLGDDKKHYPSWFRSRLRRQGRLAKKEKKS